jgi:phosphoserine phosphatase RsbU/P
VEALHRGVDDFVLKPWDNRRLLTMLAEHLARSAERREAQRSAEEERRSAENWEMQLADARATQSALLPASALRLGGYCVAGASLPFHEIGGDYFDFFRNGDGQIALCIADVMGKGVPAALLMSNLQAAVHGLNRAGLAPAELTSRVNGALCKNPRGGKFVSFFFALLNAASGTLVYTNAGHNAPTLVRANGEMERLSDGGGVLGIFPGAVFEEGEARLGAGDLLALFTDGLTEVCNPAGEELGEARLMKLLRNRRDLPPEQIHLAVLGDSKVFSGGPFRDDATLVVLTAR